jgi:hypothetical protein
VLADVAATLAAAMGGGGGGGSGGALEHASCTLHYLELYQEKLTDLFSAPEKPAAPPPCANAADGDDATAAAAASGGGGREVTLFRVGQGAAAMEARARGALHADEHYTLQGATTLPLWDAAAAARGEDGGAAAAAAAMRAIADADARKHRASTAMNERSSRAHTVLVVTLTQRRRGAVKRSVLHLVDLGGCVRRRHHAANIVSNTKT